MGDRARELHDKATRGLPLSEIEQVELEAWYAAGDRIESGLLSNGQLFEQPRALQARIDDTLARISATVHSIQEITAQNDAIRSEIAELQRRLPNKAA